MSFGDDSKPAAYQTTTTSSAPWSAQQPYLKEGFERAKTDVLEKPVEYYPNSTVVPFAPQTEQALEMQEQRALTGSPTMSAAQEMAKGTLSGEYLDAGNPYMQQAMQSAITPMATAFQEDVVPAISSQFSGAGRYGSGAQMRTQERAADDFMRQVGDVTGAMAYKGYGDERQRQLQAATLAPTYAAQDYADIGQLADVGLTREAQAGAELQEDINRFQQEQQAPVDALTKYMTLIGGGYGQTGSQTSPIYRNRTAENLGMASTAAGVAGTLFGQGGIWPQ